MTLHTHTDCLKLVDFSPHPSLQRTPDANELRLACMVLLHGLGVGAGGVVLLPVRKGVANDLHPVKQVAVLVLKRAELAVDRLVGLAAGGVEHTNGRFHRSDAVHDTMDVLTATTIFNTRLNYTGLDYTELSCR